jgi:hypothetical protein
MVYFKTADKKWDQLHTDIIMTVLVVTYKYRICSFTNIASYIHT